MSDIWLDVSTIMKWTRPPVGIIRVETEIFKYFAARNSRSVRFCTFDKKALAYRELKAEEVHRAVERAQRSTPSQPTPAVVEAYDSTAKRAVQKARALAMRLPTLVRRPLLGAGKRSEPALRRLLHEYRLKAKAAKVAGARVGERFRIRREVQATPAAPTEPLRVISPFKRGDVLLSAGLDWDHKDLTFLYEHKLALGFKVILWCYDLIPVLFPHLCVSEVAGVFARYFVDLAWSADEVMCISKSSQRDFLQLLKDSSTPAPRTSVVRLGASIRQTPSSAKIEDLAIGKYLLFVSTIERRKNHEVIYRALTQLVDQGYPNPPQVLFIGMPGWGVNDLLTDIRIDHRVRGRIALLNHVTDDQLACFYENATFTLYPSLYEGWGLPVAESLAHGKFCLASNSSSLPEVGGDLIEYIDPWDVRKWAQRIAWYLDHPEAVAQKERAIRAQYRPTSWDETGKTVFESAMRLASEGKVTKPAA